MIQVLAELERIGWGYDWAGSDNVKCKCPFHDDDSPSCHIEVKKQVYKCQAAGCGHSGDFVSFLAGALKTTRAVVWADLTKRYNLVLEKDIQPVIIERYHSQIWAAKPLLDELYARGLTDDDIRKHRLGVHQGRVTIPIKNENGLFVNIRSYLPGAPGAQKMKNLKGRSKPRLYPIDQLAYNKIVVVGGEAKAIVTATQLNPLGYGAICVTAGEGAWHHEFTPKFYGKDVWVVMDIDQGGRSASQQICQQLYRAARTIHDVVLPLDPDRYPKGDPNDFIGRENGKLEPVLLDTAEWKPAKKNQLDNNEPEDVDLVKATHADYTGKRVKLTAIVSTLDTSPYIIPKDIVIHCSRDVKECSLCPVFVEEPEKVYTVQAESPSILEMIAAPKMRQLPVIQNELEIPLSCRVCSFEAKSFYNIEDARISPRLEITNRNNDRVMMPAICIGNGLETNETYEMTGRMHPHPMTQQSTLLISAYKTSQDALSSYVPKNVERLQLFQPAEWTVAGIKDKINHIVEDYEANVTRVFQRRPLHIFVDLTYHSPLLIQFDGKQVKGWVETLIIGDSSQGKTETVMNMQQHYGLGEKVECKNASVAGLLGGLQQLGSRWFITWGVIPTHDKRLVILEELKGASVEVISKLTDMRSSGIAEIPKIEKRRTFARTRLIALSNPRSDLSIGRYNFGVEAIKELIGSLEDIRRFDACLVVSRDEIDAQLINELQTHRPNVPHTYKSDLCRELVLWAWTRTASQVIFEQEAQALILKGSTDICEKFTDGIPIVDRGSMRYKLARLSAALSARLYSTIDGECIVVRPACVQYVLELLQTAYSSKAFGYKDYTEAQNISNTLLDPDKLKKAINDTPFPNDLIKQLLHTNRIDMQDIQDWCGYDRTSAQNLLSLFVRKHAFLREGRSYRKTSPFIDLLKSMEPVERPDYIGEEF